MRCYKLIGKDIHYQIFEVTEVGEISFVPSPMYGNHYRSVKIEGQAEFIDVFEVLFRPIKVGDYIRYDVMIADYELVEQSELDNNPALELCGNGAPPIRTVRTSIVIEPEDYAAKI